MERANTQTLAVYANLRIVLEVLSGELLGIPNDLEVCKASLKAAILQCESKNLEKTIQKILDTHYPGQLRMTEATKATLIRTLEDLCQDLLWEMQNEDVEIAEYFGE